MKFGDADQAKTGMIRKRYRHDSLKPALEDPIDKTVSASVDVVIKERGIPKALNLAGSSLFGRRNKAVTLSIEFSGSFEDDRLQYAETETWNDHNKDGAFGTNPSVSSNFDN
jgi:hypothetical protein